MTPRRAVNEEHRTLKKMMNTSPDFRDIHLYEIVHSNRMGVR